MTFIIIHIFLQTDKYGSCLFDAVLKCFHMDNLEFRHQYTISDLRRMLVILMAEYWHLIVDEAFILTIQMEYAEMPEQKDRSWAIQDLRAHFPCAPISRPCSAR